MNTTAMTRTASTLTIVGALLPVTFAVAVLLPPAGHPDTWAYPTAPWLFAVLSVLLAVAHLLVLAGFVAVARTTTGAARVFAWVGALGTLLVAAAEVWSAFIATEPAAGSAAETLSYLYTASSLLIIVGSIGAGVALLRTWRDAGFALLVSGAYLLLIATPVLIIADAVTRTIVLTIWGLIYVWLGLALRRSTRHP
ncbi:hypothetical protein [Microbacterium sp.]|uniref:hypothetical protein n=1 Tax=Microbacterium sp. TaxID=51671 RepID=UPI003C721D2C